jgi:phage regulator Rha-like protein
MNSKLMLVKIDYMSSLEIAELTGKRHSDVLRDIRNIVSKLEDAQRDSALGYKLTTYVDAGGSDRP